MALGTHGMGMFLPIVTYFFIAFMDIQKWIQTNDQIKSECNNWALYILGEDITQL